MNLNQYKYIFLDRDGVINKIIKRSGIISSPRCMDEFIIRDDFKVFSEQVDKENYEFFVVTNQPDIKRGLLSMDDLNQMHSIVRQYLNFIEISYCPHDDNDKCNCRKPKSGMLDDLINKNNLNKNKCLMIGDSAKDIISANSAKIDAYLLKTNYNSTIKHSYRINSLMDLIK